MGGYFILCITEFFNHSSLQQATQYNKQETPLPYPLLPQELPDLRGCSAGNVKWIYSDVCYQWYCFLWRHKVVLLLGSWKIHINYHLTHQRECKWPFFCTVSLLLAFPALPTPVRSSLQPMQLFTTTWDSQGTSTLCTSWKKLLKNQNELQRKKMYCWQNIARTGLNL